MECQFGPVGVDCKHRADAHICKYCERRGCGKGGHPHIIKSRGVWVCSKVDQICRDARKTFLRELTRVKPGDTIVVDGHNAVVMDKQPVEREHCYAHHGTPVPMVRVRVRRIPRWGCPRFSEHTSRAR
ncbi:MAG: hypothetical protein Q8P13_02795 [bacterium]|nr:hypothetical protein [bacterium]